MPAKSADLVPASEIARVLGLTGRRIGQLAADGTIPKASRGRFSLGRVVQAYVASVKASRNASVEARRLTAAKARAAELHAAKLENALIEMDTVASVVSEVCGIFRAELAGLAAASTRDLAIRQQIEANLDGALDRCRKRFEAACEDMRAGRDPLAEGDED